VEPLKAQELLFFEDLDQRTHLVHQSFGYEISPFLREAHQFFNCPLLIARLTDSLQASCEVMKLNDRRAPYYSQGIKQAKFN
jgi:hypothetical protein